MAAKRANPSRNLTIMTPVELVEPTILVRIDPTDIRGDVTLQLEVRCQECKGVQQGKVYCKCHGHGVILSNLEVSQLKGLFGTKIADIVKRKLQTLEKQIETKS